MAPDCARQADQDRILKANNADALGAEGETFRPDLFSGMMGQGSCVGTDRASAPEPATVKEDA